MAGGPGIAPAARRKAMSPSRRKTWWGVVTALGAVGLLGVLFYSGVLPGFRTPEPGKPLCWVSPKNPNYIKEAPGQDPEGHELVPVYPTPAGGAKARRSGGGAFPGGAPGQVLALSHAPGNCQGCPRQMPEVRHGPGADP